MPKLITPLSDLKCSNAKPREKAYTLPDGKGLHLLVEPSGRKTWEFIYLSPTHGKRRKTSFGRFPDTSLKSAREERAKYFSLIGKDIDPIDQYRLEKSQRSTAFKDVIEEWLAFGEAHVAKETFKQKKAL